MQRRSSLAQQMRALSILVAALATLCSACQSTMSVEEAKKVAASFRGTALIPPPRSIEDITAILDRQKAADAEGLEKTLARLREHPPATTDSRALAAFYRARGILAFDRGRVKQAREDLGKSAEFSRTGEILLLLGRAEATAGSLTRGVQHLKEAVAEIPSDQTGLLLAATSILAGSAAIAGDLATADAALRVAANSRNQSRASRNVDLGAEAAGNTLFAWAQGNVAETRGRLGEAEAFYREALSEGTKAHVSTTDFRQVTNRVRVRLVEVLIREGRLLEAENEARLALLTALREHGRYSLNTGFVLGALVSAINAEGRHTDAEALARAQIDIFEKTGASSESLLLAQAQDRLGQALTAQGRWIEALAVYDALHNGLKGDPDTFERLFRGNVTWALALIKVGRPNEAADILQVAVDRDRRVLGENNRSGAQAQGLLGVVHIALGKRTEALAELRRAIQILFAQGLETHDREDATRSATTEQVLGMVLAEYVGLMADIRGTPLEKQTGLDAAAEAFRVADVARTRSVQRAIQASAARAAVGTSALAALVRQEQDAAMQIAALHSLLAGVLGQPADQQTRKTAEYLHQQVDLLTRARQTLRGQIQSKFPRYVELVDPPLATIEQARASLRSGEALVTTYVADERTYVWAVPRSGPVAFVSVPLGAKALDAAITKLRAALDPSAKTLGDIPAFDVSTAHDLFRHLLEPVKSGWASAQSLLLVPHGPLAQLPFALLPTKPSPLGPASGVLFSNYRTVPWLVRTHAVTMLPSVTSLITLRALPAGDPNRRPFVGFGDPYFSPRQAQRAVAEEAASEPTLPLGVRGVPITLRSSPNRQLASGQLAMLPRLPETADEIRSIALAMNADLTKDVFLGVQANEHTVGTLNLAGYRVIVFATHGLVPGDLDGLIQPALALTAPEVAKVPGDGLLTMEKILALQLNADWVVLSACNTASGNGKGSEAISGLGRAFFYAGARALLVSNWPVETTSAKRLTTDLFRRQAANPTQTRAQALQQTQNALIDEPGYLDPQTMHVVYSYAHPIFWAPFTLVGDGG